MKQERIQIGLHEKQIRAFTTPATELLYGGAAGGGKSYLLRVAAITWCQEIPKLQVYMFRRIFDDLVKNHMEGAHGFRAMLQPWVEAGSVSIIEDQIRFSNGSKIFLCHCQHDKDRFKYQGAEIHVLMIDELTLFTEKIYRFLRNRVRMAGVELPEKYKGMFPRILAASNPGNIGHNFVKKAFIDPVPEGTIWRAPSEDGGMLRQFIRAKLDDNPSLVESDPGYEARLSGLGSEALVRAMRDGDWDVLEGAFFDTWDRRKHVVEPFEIPKEWTRFISMDWGSAKPFAIHWWAIADGNYGDYPRGALINYREWYGCREGAEDVGLKMDAEDVRDEILRKTGNEQIAYVVADPAMWGSQSGPSIAETMFNPGPGNKGLRNLRKADNRRVGRRGSMGGWDQVRMRLKLRECGDGVKRPMIYFFSTSVHTIRTLPALIHDEDNPEDLDTDMEDHAADSVRYACMSRPIDQKKRKWEPLIPQAGHFEASTVQLPSLGDPLGWGTARSDDDE